MMIHQQKNKTPQDFALAESNISYSQAFDLYRSIAVLSVVIGHFVLYYPHMNIWLRLPLLLPINYGVPIFFLISGYLLAASYHGIRRRMPRTSIAILTFYRSRILRIYPAYLFWLFFLGISGSEGGWDFIVHLFNIHNLFSEYWDSINPVFWSLAVEFQWYILAPVFITWLLADQCKTVVTVFSLCLIVSLVFRNIFIHEFINSFGSVSDLWRLGTAQIYTELYSFLLGILVFRFKEDDFHLSKAVAGCVWIFLAVVSVFTYIVATSEKMMMSWMMSVMLNIKYLSQFGLAVLIFHYRHIKLPEAFLRSVHFIALISYSLYLAHLPILDRMKSLPYPLIAKFIIYIFLSTVIAFFSYLFVEKPAILFARRLSSRSAC